MNKNTKNQKITFFQIITFIITITNLILFLMLANSLHNLQNTTTKATVGLSHSQTINSERISCLEGNKELCDQIKQRNQENHQ